MFNTTENYTRFPFDINAAFATHAGASLLTETIDLTGLSHGLQRLNRYTPETATHRGDRILTEMTTMIAFGGDCPQAIDLLRTTTGQHPLFGQVTFAPTEARFIEQLTTQATVSAVTHFNAAVKAARAKAWELAGERSPMHEVSERNLLLVDLDATVIISHSEDKDGRCLWRVERNLRAPPVAHLRRLPGEGHRRTPRVFTTHRQCRVQYHQRPFPAQCRRSQLTAGGSPRGGRNCCSERIRQGAPTNTSPGLPPLVGVISSP